MTLQEKQDKEVLRVIKAIGFPVSARALHEIFRGRIAPVEVNQSFWRHINTKVQFDNDMRVYWIRAAGPVTSVE